MQTSMEVSAKLILKGHFTKWICNILSYYCACLLTNVYLSDLCWFSLTFKLKGNDGIIRIRAVKDLLYHLSPLPVSLWLLHPVLFKGLQGRLTTSFGRRPYTQRDLTDRKFVLKLSLIFPLLTFIPMYWFYQADPKSFGIHLQRKKRMQMTALLLKLIVRHLLG